MYKNDNYFTTFNYNITIVGCGGTGAYLAEGLCRILNPFSNRLILVDFDRVENRNLSRQDFFREDLGKFKSEVIAHRLSRLYDRPVAYAVSPVQLAQICYPGIIIGCVDDGKGRGAIAKRLSDHSSLTMVGGYSRAVPMSMQHGPEVRTNLWWVDAGNGANFGQILIGNAGFRQLSECFNPETGLFRALPYPTIQCPDLLAQAAPVIEPDCAEIAEQEPAINRAIASLVVEVVRRLINGSCSWMQLWLDLDAGTLTPVLATPENVQKITKGKVKNLIEEEK